MEFIIRDSDNGKRIFFEILNNYLRVNNINAVGEIIEFDPNIIRGKIVVTINNQTIIDSLTEDLINELRSL